MSGRLTSPKGDANLQGRETGIIVSLKNSTTLKGEKMKRIIALAIALVMVLAMTSSALAYTEYESHWYSGRTSNNIDTQTTSYGRGYGFDNCYGPAHTSRVYYNGLQCQNRAMSVSDYGYDYVVINSNGLGNECHMNIKNNSGGTLTFEGYWGMRSA